MSERVGGYTGNPPVGGKTVGDPPVGVKAEPKPGGFRLKSDKVGL
jgi:hypothetical protein